ncbi:hypothetical protein GYMLUDRAFT_938204 [Collybiopsis luxurians FD-317 M1]|uniref:Uncharacterized protein n=1 Tax=Collybiopsis luxurians FD-317 M1 TaxID=944289 RepID=A0A0D0BFA8_9AGAR|nr:hypothetical protein GYMLUDRAFT_938204 [Collybiopsis luxurians FD-317 M1]
MLKLTSPALIQCDQHFSLVVEPAEVQPASKYYLYHVHILSNSITLISLRKKVGLN